MPHPLPPLGKYFWMEPWPTQWSSETLLTPLLYEKKRKEGLAGQTSPVVARTGGNMCCQDIIRHGRLRLQVGNCIYSSCAQWSLITTLEKQDHGEWLLSIWASKHTLPHEMDEVSTQGGQVQCHRAVPIQKTTVILSWKQSSRETHKDGVHTTTYLNAELERVHQHLQHLNTGIKIMAHLICPRSSYQLVYGNLIILWSQIARSGRWDQTIEQAGR